MKAWFAYALRPDSGQSQWFGMPSVHKMVHKCDGDGNRFASTPADAEEKYATDFSGNSRCQSTLMVVC